MGKAGRPKGSKSKNPAPPISQETREKISAARKAYWVKRREAAGGVITFSPEHRQRIGQAVHAAAERRHSSVVA